MIFSNDTESKQPASLIQIKFLFSGGGSATDLVLSALISAVGKRWFPVFLNARDTDGTDTESIRFSTMCFRCQAQNPTQ